MAAQKVPRPADVVSDVLDRINRSGNVDLAQAATQAVHGAHEDTDEQRYWRLFAVLLHSEADAEVTYMATKALHVAPTRFNSPAWNRKNVAPASWVCCILAALCAEVPGYDDRRDPVHREVVATLAEMLIEVEDITPLGFTPDEEGMDEAVTTVRALLGTGAAQHLPTTTRILNEAIGRIAAPPKVRSRPNRQAPSRPVAGGKPPGASATSGVGQLLEETREGIIKGLLGWLVQPR